MVAVMCVHMWQVLQKSLVSLAWYITWPDDITHCDATANIEKS